METSIGRYLLTALLLLTSCAGNKSPPSLLVAAGPACRVGLDGGPVLTERGIGGTGIDKTGVLGIITGFASICIGGTEVGVDPAIPILLDNQPGVIADLRAGQLAAIEAVGSNNGLRATRVQVRHEVVGPVQAIEPGGMLQVAGQRVATTPETLGSAPRPGAWIAVSGFRRPDGVIQATRLDPQPSGPSLVTGVVTQESSRYRIGGVDIRSTADLVPGQPVIATGHWSNAMLLADTVQPDRLAAGPFGYFPANTGKVLFERFAGLSGSRLIIDRFEHSAAGNIARRATVELARRPDGGLQPSSAPRSDERRTGRLGEPISGTFTPAPVPFGGRGPNSGPLNGPYIGGFGGARIR